MFVFNMQGQLSNAKSKLRKCNYFKAFKKDFLTTMFLNKNKTHIKNKNKQAKSPTKQMPTANPNNPQKLKSMPLFSR